MDHDGRSTMKDVQSELKNTNKVDALYAAATSLCTSIVLKVLVYCGCTTTTKSALANLWPFYNAVATFPLLWECIMSTYKLACSCQTVYESVTSFFFLRRVDSVGFCTVGPRCLGEGQRRQGVRSRHLCSTSFVDQGAFGAVDPLQRYSTLLSFVPLFVFRT